MKAISIAKTLLIPSPLGRNPLKKEQILEYCIVFNVTDNIIVKLILIVRENCAVVVKLQGIRPIRLLTNTNKNRE